MKSMFKSLKSTNHRIKLFRVLHWTHKKLLLLLEKIYVLVVGVVNLQGDKPIKNVNVKVFRLEMEPITLTQWAENPKNGTPFKRLVLSMNTDDNGNVTAEL